MAVRKELIVENVKRFCDRAKALEGGVLPHAIREIDSFVRYGSSPDDYFRYEFYKKSHLEQKKFITYRRSRQIIQRYNDPAYTETFQNKVKFYQFFSDMIHREYLDLREATQDQFESFLTRHGAVLIKPSSGSQGNGVYRLTLEDYRNGACSLELPQDYLAEEILQQHSDMKKLNPSSVNTVRVLTFFGEIIACTLRIGSKGAVADNMHMEGLGAHLDVDTGIIDTAGRNYQFTKYLFHPDTNEKLVGFSVPHWDAVREIATTAAARIPNVAYVGWDVAVLEDTVALIEGNHDPSHDLVQMIAQIGLYPKIQEIIRKQEKA